MKLSVYIAVSLDGFIARKNGDIDWLVDGDEGDKSGNEPYGYKAFIDSVDILVMGRNSYEKVLTFSEWPYADTPVIVLSHSIIQPPKNLQESVSFSSETPVELASRLSAKGVSHLYIDGGITIANFLAEGLIDEMTLTRIPVILGDGIPLFHAVGRDIVLIHIFTKAFDNGYVQSKYRVTRK